MYCLIAFTLLLFEIGCSFGHTLPRKEILNNMDVYSVQENNHDTLTIVNPKSTKPTVKEIIFYHFIEKPYEQSQVVITHREETLQGPDFDDSRRPFTNGHGEQINHLDSNEDEDDDDNTSDESIESTHLNDGDSSNEDRSSEADEDVTTDHNDTVSVSDDSESEDDKSDDSDDSKEKSSSGEENNVDEDINANDRISNLPVVEDIISSSSKEFDSNEGTESIETSTSQTTVNRDDINASETNTEEVTVIAEPNGAPVVDEVESEKIAARNIIFNQLREADKESWSPTVVYSRKKRDIEYNDSEDVDVVGVKDLPEMPEAAKPERPELRIYNEETGSGDGTEVVKSEAIRPYEEGELVSDSKEDAPNKPRTYGMELINGTGYTWNELSKMPGEIGPELNLDELPQNTRDKINSENPEQPELNNDHVDAESEVEERTEEIITKALSPYEEGEDVSDSKEEAPNRPRTYGMQLNNGTGYVWNELAEISQTPILPEPKKGELTEITRDEVSTESPELPEMPETPFLPELNVDELELPENTRDEISSENPELPEMPEAPVLPELNSDELAENTREEISSEKSELPEMPEAPVLPELNSDELPEITRDEISSEKPELPVMPEAPTLPEPNLDEVPRNTGDEMSSEKPELPEMPAAPVLPELNLYELPQVIRDVISTENAERSELRNNNEETDRGIEDRTEKINSEVVTSYEEGGVGDTTTQNPTTYSMEFDSGRGYVWNGSEEKSSNDGEERDRADWEDEDINVNNRETPELYNNNDNETKKEIEHRIDEMISEVMRPYEEREDVGPSEEEATKKPRTYGMKLKNEAGYVWNDLWGNPGMSYVVGDPSRLSSEEHEENVTKKDEPEETKDPDNSRSDLEDIYVNKDENLSNEEDRNRTIENENTSFDTLEENSSYNYISSEQFTIGTTEAYYNDKEPLNGEENIAEKGKTLEDSKANQSNITESIIELLKNQDNEFWVWLQDWTSTYMELLMKHVKKIVEQEVRKQLNLRKDHLDHEKSHIETDYSEFQQQDGKVIIKANTNNKDETITIDGVEIPVTHDTNFDISDILNGDKFTEIYEKSQTELLKGRRHKGKDKEATVQISNVETISGHSKPEIKEKLDANNIFGNSYNNDKVTNIYIFYPKEDSKKITEDLKLDKDNNKTAFIFERPECTKIKENELAKKELEPIINNINEITTSLNPTEETLQPTESSNKDELEKSEHSEEKIDERERDNKEISQVSTSESPIANFDIEIASDNVKNEQNKVNKNEEDVSEKTLQPTESLNKDELENSEEKVDENDNKETSQISTSESPIANVDIEIASDNVKNEQNKVNKNEEGFSEKTDTTDIIVKDTHIKITPNEEEIATDLEQDTNINDNKGVSAERKNGEIIL